MQVVDTGLLLPSSYQYMGCLQQLEVLHLYLPDGVLQQFPEELTACVNMLTALKALAILGRLHAFFTSRSVILCHMSLC